MNENATKLCEICQIKLEGDGNLLNNDYKLKLLPKTDLHLTQNSIICDQCFTDITSQQELKQFKDEDNIDKLPLSSDANFKEVVVNDNIIYIKEEPGVEKVEEEFNVGLVKEEIVKDDFLANTGNEEYHCHDCGWCTDTKQKLMQHIQQHKKKDLVLKPDSEKCNYKVRYKKYLKNHISSNHTDEKPYQRDKCDYKSASLVRHTNEKPTSHISKHNDEYSFQCEVCDHKFTRRCNLKAHILTIHSDEKPYQCDKCEFKSARKDHLKRHELSHTGEYPFQCDHCGYKCSDNYTLKNHILSQHTSEKRYQCDKCDYKCTSKSGLKVHTFIHTGDYPFKCDKCDYKSARRHNLKSHQLSHTGEYPFKCDKCDYKSARRHNLKSHQLSHTGEYPFKCHKCEFKSARRDRLARHELSHTGECPFQCDNCDYKCKDEYTLKNHILSQHTVKVPIEVF